MHQLYGWLFAPVMVFMWLLGAAGKLPRTKPSVQYEGYERRCSTERLDRHGRADVLWGLWKGCRAASRRRPMLAAFAALMAAWMARLPRVSPAHTPHRAGRADHDRLVGHLDGQRRRRRRVVLTYMSATGSEPGARVLHDAHNPHQQFFLDAEEGRVVLRLHVANTSTSSE